MEQNFCDPSPLTGWGFSYAGRLYHYRGVNQVDAIIRRLREHPAAKSATLCLLDPAGDVQHTPCLVALDWKIREGRLCLHAFFRSQDVGRKLTADAGELLRLSRQIAAALSLTDVRLYLSLASAHLYEADLPWLRAILNDHTP